MEPFLKTTAVDILRRFGKELYSVQVVLPTRRSCLFFKNYLAEATNEVIWSPDVISIEDFIFQYSTATPADPVDLMFDLWEVYQALNSNGEHSFDDFSVVADILIDDFNEIDLNLIKPDEIFEYLHESRAIQLWNPDGSELTPFQRKYLAFYASLKDYYHGLRARVEQRGEAWHGLATRQVVESIESNQWNSRFNKIIFVGFNAFSPAEERIGELLYKEDKALFYWDIDRWYIENREHEAGLFFRNYQQRQPFGNLGEPADFLENYQRTINIRGLSLSVAQARFAGELLRSAPFTQHPDWQKNTAIVIADESLLLPLLNSLPDTIGHFNVTMGLPLSQTLAGNLADLWLNLQNNVRVIGDERCYRLSDLKEFATHPLLASTVLVELNKQLNQNLAKGLLYGACSIIDPLFGPIDSTMESGSNRALMQRLLNIVKAVYSHFEIKSRDQLTELSVEALIEVLTRLDAYLLTAPVAPGPQLLRRLIGQLMARVRIPLTGEPLQGVQIMGLLETRTLDFDNVILIGVNDEVIPGAGFSSSFVPADIRSEVFKMTGFKEKNSVMAYHFYRLLQRSSSAWLLYNAIPGDLGKGQPSRFIEQIRYEFPQAQTQTILTDEVVVSVPTPELPLPISIAKDDKVFGKILERIESGIAPTNLSRYLNCPLQFYFTDVIKIVEPLEIGAELNPAEFGNVLHKTFETLLSPALNRLLTPADFTFTDEYLINLLRSNLPEGRDFVSGPALLQFKVLVLYVKRFLKKEIERLSKNSKMVISGLEKRIKVDFKVLVNNVPYVVKFKGTIDRIESDGNTLVVVDYKTGSVSDSDVRISGVNEAFSKSLKQKALQLIMYMWLLREDGRGAGSVPLAGLVGDNAGAGHRFLLDNIDLKAGIWPIAAPNRALVNLDDKLADKFDDGFFDDFESELSGVMEELLDRDHPFMQTDDPENCKYCSYRITCNRG